MIANRALDLAPLFGMAVQLRLKGRAQEAKPLFEAVLKVQRNHFDTLRHLSQIYASEDRLEDALRLIRRAVDQKPNDAEAQNDLGGVLARLGDTKTAMARFERAVALRPEYVAALMNLGSTADFIGRAETAVAAFEKALAINPNLRDAAIRLRNSRSFAMQAAGDLAGAIACYAVGITEAIARIPLEFTASASAVSAEKHDGREINALRNVVHQLDRHGITAFLIGGALIGAMRGGELLAFDKDIDFGVFASVTVADLDRALARGTDFRRIHRPDQEGIVVSYRSSDGVGFDFSRVFCGDTQVWYGLNSGPYTIKWLHQPFDLIDIEFHGVRVKIPDDADRFLTEEYGDWRTPDPYFALWASPNIEGGYSPPLRRMAYGSIFQALNDQAWARAAHICDQILSFDPDDALIQEVRRRLAGA